MITLSKKLKGPEERRSSGNENPAPSRRISIRDRLLVKEVQELEANLPTSCSISFENPDELWHLELNICPEEGFWKDGKFSFDIHISQEYNMVPPVVKCHTKLWHPNISEDGDVCLSLLRQNAIDGLGWSPTRTLKDVVWGLNSLFTDLLNFDDPLNIEAAEHYQKDRDGFRIKVKEYVQSYAKR